MVAAAVVTVVIPCFNQGEFLEECIASLFAQREERWRAIVVDDASTDGVTPAVCERLCDTERVRLVRLSENQGRCRARNLAIEQARTEAIFPLDADDLLRPDHLEKTVPLLLERDDVGFVYTDYEKFGADSGLLRGQPFCAATMYRERYVWAGSLFRRSAWERVGGYDDAFRDGSEDYDLFLSLVDAGYVGAYLPEPLVRYRCHPQSWTASGMGSGEQGFRARLTLLERHRDGFARHRATRRFTADTYAAEAARCRSAGDSRARMLAFEALRNAPLSPELWLLAARCIF